MEESTSDQVLGDKGGHHYRAHGGGSGKLISGAFLWLFPRPRFCEPVCHRLDSSRRLGADGGDPGAASPGSSGAKAQAGPPRRALRSPGNPRPDGGRRGDPLCARSARLKAARSPAPEGFTLRLKGDNGVWIDQHRRNRVHL